VGQFDVLFQPLRIGRVVLKNRIAMAPMGVDYMVNSDGSLNRRVVEYYLERIRHGVGLVICSVFKVENRVEALESCAPMITETSLGYLGELCDAAHTFGARIFVQLTAGFGRVTVPITLRGPCVSASANPNFWDPDLECRALMAGEIRQIVTAMGDTAARLAVVGVDGIELHGHEGYLFDQFTASVWNRRTDAYGGSLENRLRFPVECLEEIRRRVGERLAVQYRFGLKHYMKDRNHGALPGESFQEAGRDVAEGLAMAKFLEQAGFDSLHVDAGCYESHYWPHPPIYQRHGCMVDMAARTKAAVALPVVGVGRLDKPVVAARAVADGQLDVAAIGRGFLADPQWVDKVKAGRPEQIRPCVGCYDGCFGSYAKLRNISCALNPASGRERAYRLESAAKTRDVMVIGGGIAGLEAARVAALRGHRVMLYEKEAELGGLVRQAAVPEFKKDLRRLLHWYEGQIDASGVTLHLETEITPDRIRALAPDVVIVATGARPLAPPIPGVDGARVVTAVDLLKGTHTPGEHVVIVGGGLAGCEIAIWLAGKGRRTTIVEILPDLMGSGVHVPAQVKMMTRDLLAQCGTTIMTACRVDAFTPDGMTVIPAGQAPQSLTPDTIVLATGMAPEVQLADQAEKIMDRVYRIGDCREPRNVMNAVWDAYEVARFI
jgi:2-enoate reductase